MENLKKKIMDSQDPAELKNLGNSYIKSGNVLKAAEAYSTALDLPQNDPTLTFFLYSNLSYANYLLGNYCDAFYDACKAIETDASQFKGYLRRSNVFEKLFFIDESINDINTAIKLAKNPKEIETLNSRLSILQKLKDSISNPQISCTDPPYSIKIKNDLDLTSAKSIGEFVFDNKGLSIDNPANFFTKIKLLFKNDMRNSTNDTIRLTVPKITILGNIYGDLGKLYLFFDKNGYPSKENVYLINGNFIGQGDHRIIIILFLFKLAEPSSIYFTKSVFDSFSTTKCIVVAEKFLQRKFGDRCTPIILSILEDFPLCVIVNDKFAVMSGGPPLNSTSIWGQFSRFIKNTENSEGFHRIDGYPMYSYGEDVVSKFLVDNNCECLICSSQPIVEGYEVLMDGKFINVSFSKINENFKANKSGYIEIIDKDIKTLVFDFDLFPLEVHYDENKYYFQGVFYTMRKYLNENPAKNGTIGIFAISEDFVPVSSTIDSSIYEIDYMSVPTPGSWILVDFKDRKMRVENYSIESARLNENNDHMKSWKIEGSNDGKYWIVLDIQNNVNELNGPMHNQVFGIKENAREFFRYIRILQHKKNHRGNWNLCLGHFDLFGTVK